MQSLLNVTFIKTDQEITINNSKYYQFTLKGNHSIIQKLKNISSRTKHMDFIDTIHLSSVPKHVTTQIHGFDISRNFPGGKYCAEPITYNIIGKNFTKTCGYKFTQNHTVNFSELNLWMTFSQNGLLERYVTICLGFYLHSSCPLQKIAKNFTFAVNRTLNINNEMFSPSQYLPLRDGIAICRKEVTGDSRLKWQHELQKALRYISIIGTSISILFYFLIIIFLHFCS